MCYLQATHRRLAWRGLWALYPCMCYVETSVLLFWAALTISTREIYIDWSEEDVPATDSVIPGTEEHNCRYQRRGACVLRELLSGTKWRAVLTCAPSVS